MHYLPTETGLQQGFQAHLDKFRNERKRVKVVDDFADKVLILILTEQFITKVFTFPTYCQLLVFSSLYDNI